MPLRFTVLTNSYHDNPDRDKEIRDLGKKELSGLSGQAQKTRRLQAVTEIHNPDTTSAPPGQLFGPLPEQWQPSEPDQWDELGRELSWNDASSETTATGLLAGYERHCGKKP